jgi:hypothetical protein
MVATDQNVPIKNPLAMPYLILYNSSWTEETTMAAKTQTYQENPDWTEAQRKVFHRVNRALPIALGYLSNEIPVLDNHTDAMLVDEVGGLKQALKPFKKAEAAHVERLKARIGDKDGMDGVEFKAEYRGSKRVILNQERCKETMTKWDDEGIDLDKLLAAIIERKVALPNEVFIADGDLLNTDKHHTTAAGGRSLFVEPIA